MQVTGSVPRQLTTTMAAKLGLLSMGIADAQDWSDSEIGASLFQAYPASC